MAQSMKIDAGHFTDVGYRFRFNKYEKLDHWIPFYPDSEEIFFDLKFYN